MPMKEMPHTVNPLTRIMDTNFVMNMDRQIIAMNESSTKVYFENGE